MMSSDTCILPINELAEQSGGKSLVMRAGVLTIENLHAGLWPSTRVNAERADHLR